MTDKSNSRAIKEFLGEAEEIIESLNMDVVALGDAAEQGEVDPDLINRIFRGAHSIKGLSGMFGFEDISELAHHAEDLLDGLRLGRLALSRELIDVLFEVLETLFRLVHGKGEDQDFTLDLTPALGRIEGLRAGAGEKREDPFEKYRIDRAILNVLTEYEEHRLRENLEKGRHLLRIVATLDLASFDQELAEITEILKRQGEVISTLPSTSDQPNRIAFQILCGTAANIDQIAEAVASDSVSLEVLVRGAISTHDRETGAGEEPHDLVEPSGDIEAIGADGTTLRSISRTVRVDIDKLDTLMNIVGELVLSKAAIAAIGEQLKANGHVAAAGDLAKATRILERRLDELQKGVMEVRMVPVAQLFEKMVRIVRRIAGEQGKKVGLELSGTETELDKLIVEDLSDPLMHLIRNAIDHGIESPEERQAAGKPEKAIISLKASQKGNHVVIEVRDDGRGIDLEKARQKGIRLGMISADVELSREAILELLFAPGFSTRDEVTDLSGRGVGLDVVKNNISALSGMIELNSELGEGTFFGITLPITLAIIKALIVQVGSKTYAIPINSVLETLMIDPGAIKTIERREVIELRETTLPLLRLANVFNVFESERDKQSFVAVVGLADKRMGIVVDDLLGQQDVVIKSLGNTLSFVRGIAGAADLGNQRTVLVLDVGGLMGEALRGEATFYV